MGWVVDMLPLPIIEISAYFVSILGVALILLARGLQRRLDAAYHLTLWVLAGGVVFALTSALDIEQAVLLSIMFVALQRCHRFFYRRSSLFDERFTRGWYIAIAGVLAATASLAWMGYGHDIVSTRVFWQYEEMAQAPRAARALSLAFITLLTLSLARLLRPAARAGHAAGDGRRGGGRHRAGVAARQRASRLPRRQGPPVRRDPYRIPHGRHLRRESRRHGRSRSGRLPPRPGSSTHSSTTATGTGAGPCSIALARSSLYLYLDYGLSIVKLGEVAHVPLADFSLDGPDAPQPATGVPQARGRRLLVRGVEPDRCGTCLPELRAVSDEWLARQHSREKGFSLGRFDEAFISRAVRVGVVRVDGAHRRVRHGVAVRRARRSRGGPHALLERCAARRDALRGRRMMLWARSQGYSDFNLGMVPLSGITHRYAWRRSGTRSRARCAVGGERYYNFQGLREFKEWFHPEWEPSYLVSPGGIRRPVIVANIASLISGGAAGLIRK